MTLNVHGHLLNDLNNLKVKFNKIEVSAFIVLKLEK